jgi:hypothetical protein
VQLVIFDGGPAKFDGTVALLHAGRYAERTFSERETETEYALAVYEPNGDTREVEIERGSGERRRVETKTAIVLAYQRVRWVAKEPDREAHVSQLTLV